MIIILLFLALFLTGCGDSDDGVTVNTVPTATSNPLLIDQARAVQFSQLLFNVGSTTGSLLESQATSANVLTDLNGARPLSLMTSLMASAAGLVQGGSRTINGPRGGSVTVTLTTDSVRTLNLAFANFATANATLTGNVNMVGRQDPDGGQVNATFTQLRVTSAGRAYQIDGPAVLVRDANTINFSSEAAIADQTGGTARLRGFNTVVTFTQSGTSVAGTSASNGNLEFQDFRGLTGTVQVSSGQPVAFTADFATEVTTVTAGQIFYKGDGTLRLTVVAPNQMEVALQPPGASVFTPVQTVNFQTLLQ